MKQSLTARIFRATVSLIAIAAWFHASNHCALGEIVRKTPPVANHASCHPQEAPAENGESGGDCADLSCCKSFAVVAPSMAKNLLGDDLSFQIVKDDLEQAAFSFRVDHDAPIAELDTGPPDCDSFAESVLQRSLLAHAPPLA